MRDEHHKEWSRKVISRDKKCQMPHCRKRSRLQAHHILRWANNPLLRYDTDNGIALCHYHHKEVTGKEDIYASLFFQILRNKR